jgi:hypothetical protein
VDVNNSTISGNSTASSGGGIRSRYDFELDVTIKNSILAGNTDDGTAPDVQADAGAFITLSVEYSIIGNNTGTGLIEAQSPDANGNLIGGPTGGIINARLGPLIDNGGPTTTHALLPGSPALDAGDPTFMPPPDFDQRGEGFPRVVNGGGGLRIDIGAYESQGVPSFAPGDYNQNGIVDAGDYVAWRKTLGSSVAPYSGADGSGNGLIDPDDYGVWTAHFGMTLQTTAAETASATAAIGADDARPVGFPLLDTASPPEDMGSRSRGRTHRIVVADSGSDDLLLLAINRVRHPPHQDFLVSDDSRNGDHRDDDIASKSPKLLGKSFSAREIDGLTHG